MTRASRVCYWRALGPLAGQPGRVIEQYPLARTVVVEFQGGEVRRVPTQTLKKRKAGPPPREGAR